MKTNGSVFENLKENLNNQNLQGKLDINYNIVQQVLSKIIFNYYKALYWQDFTIVENFADIKFNKYIKKQIMKDKEYYVNSLVSIVIVSASLKNQTIETINYIKDLTLSVDISVQYERENKVSRDKVLIKTSYTEELLLKNYEEGWKLSKILLQDNIVKNTKEI